MKKNPQKFNFWHFGGIIIPLFMFLLILGVFFTQKTAFAKTVSLTEQSVVGTQWRYGNLYQFLGNGWHDGHYLLRFKFKNESGRPQYIYIYFYKDVTANSWKEMQEIDFWGNANYQDLGNNVYLYDLDLGEITGISPDKNIGIYVGYYATGYAYPVGYTTRQDDYYLYYTVNPDTEYPDIKTNYIEMTDEGFFTPPNNIVFNYPQNNSTITADFDNWQLGFNVSNFDYYYKTKVSYKPTDGPLIWTDEEQAVTKQNYNPFIAFIPKSHLLPFSEGQTSRDWQATAFLIRCDDGYQCQQQTEIASSTITFTFINPKTGAPTGEISTSTLPQITCDPESGLFNYSLCKLFTWLFIPDAEILNKYSNLAEGIKNKPPIGYYYAIKDVLSGFNSTTTPAFELAQVSSLTNNIFNPLKTGISFILWLIFGFWLFNRIRHFEL